MILSCMPVLRLTENRVGRDFVLGDICGDFEGVHEAMQQAKVDPTRDRIFSVGHLTGCSETTSSVLRFLRHPAVYAVRSDAEQDVLDLYGEGEPDEGGLAALGAAFPGLAWVSAAAPAARKQVLETIRCLPLAISVGGRADAGYGFVHGGAPAGLSWTTFIDALVQKDEPLSQDAVRGFQIVDSATAAVEGVGRLFVCFSPGKSGRPTPENVKVVPPGTRLLPIYELAPISAQIQPTR